MTTKPLMRTKAEYVFYKYICGVCNEVSQKD